MVLSILVILFLMWYFTGGFVTSAAKKDIFSMEPHQIIMESQNWALSVPQNKERAPYLIYKGKDDPGTIATVTGVAYYPVETGAAKQKNLSGNSQVEESAVLDHHFLLGEKRWYLPVGLASMEFEKSSLTIMWKSKAKMHSEPIL